MTENTIWNMGKERVLNLFFPLRCPVCDRPVPYGEGRICQNCAGKLKRIEPPYCMKCGKSLCREEEYCRDCRSRTHHFLRGRALYEYRSAAVGIYRFKYASREEYALFYAEQMALGLKEFVRWIKPEGIVPVPLSKERLKLRGYNQAELLAKEVGRILHIPVYTNLAKRIKNTVPQKELNEKQRQNNLKKAFKIEPDVVKLKTITIIDDIYTTGTTMDALAEVFLEAGAENVYFMTLAIGSTD